MVQFHDNGNKDKGKKGLLIVLGFFFVFAGVFCVLFPPAAITAGLVGLILWYLLAGSFFGAAFISFLKASMLSCLQRFEGYDRPPQKPALVHGMGYVYAPPELVPTGIPQVDMSMIPPIRENDRHLVV